MLGTNAPRELFSKGLVIREASSPDAGPWPPTFYSLSIIYFPYSGHGTGRSLSTFLGFQCSVSLPVQSSSVTQSCPALCDPMNRSTPGLPVHHQLPESTQTHVHRVGDAIQPSHPLSSPSPPVLNLSQHQGLFQ